MWCYSHIKLQFLFHYILYYTISLSVCYKLSLNILNLSNEKNNSATHSFLCFLSSRILSFIFLVYLLFYSRNINKNSCGYVGIIYTDWIQVTRSIRRGLLRSFSGLTVCESFVVKGYILSFLTRLLPLFSPFKWQCTFTKV